MIDIRVDDQKEIPKKYLLKNNYLSEFQTQEEKDEVLKNLQAVKRSDVSLMVKGIILTREEYDNLPEYKTDVIYFVTED